MVNVLKGEITSAVSLEAALSIAMNLGGEIASSIALEGELEKGDSLAVYEGDLVITPSSKQQEIATKQRRVMENVVVNPIPYHEVPNSSGGNTIVIGA